MIYLLAVKFKTGMITDGSEGILLTTAPTYSNPSTVLERRHSCKQCAGPHDVTKVHCHLVTSPLRDRS